MEQRMGLFHCKAEHDGIEDGKNAQFNIGLQGKIAMTSISSAGSIPGAGTGFLDKERTIATAGFNRWLVPPAALAFISASAWPMASACSGCRCRARSG